MADKIIKVAVAGNPNTGKTTLINAIAGTNLHVGNWPGVTLEKKEARFKYRDYEIHLIDLPGTYSLSNDTAEEKIAVEFLIKEKPDVVIDVVDSTNLERNLYLTVQLLELEAPLVVALNMWDEAKSKGIDIDVEKLEKLLCIRAVPTSAVKEEGIKELLDAVIEIYERKEKPKCVLHFEDQVEEHIKGLIDKIKEVQPILLDLYPARYLALSLIEGNTSFIDLSLSEDIQKYVQNVRKEIEKLYHKDPVTFIVEERYSIIISIYEQVVKKHVVKSVDITFLLDKVFLHKLFGLPIFFLLMWILFEFTFELSSPYVDWLDETLSSFIAPLTAQLLSSLGASEWLQSFVSEGIIGGVGFVLVFVPVLFFLYVFMAFLEGSGYMARAAFLMDRFMSVLGLSGKSFIPMIIGFGCNVPAVYATRTLENPKEKILTVLMIPFMSCGARLTVYAFFVTIFFTQHKTAVIMSLYLLGIAVAVIIAFILQKTYFKSQSLPFILELPPYRLPTMRFILRNAWIKTRAFLYEAGTFILATSVVIWFLLHFPVGVKKTEDSVFGHISKAIAPVFEPLGFGNWQAAGALMSGFVAKEVVIATMGNIYAGEVIQETEEEKIDIKEKLVQMGTGFLQANVEAGKKLLSIFGIDLAGGEEEEEFEKTLLDTVKNAFTPLTAFSFLVFLLLYTPCMATVFAIKQELGSWKWAGISVVISFTSAWIVSFTVYHIGKIFF
ncbi:ferrous iron transport protein B [Persephonella atlantica]|uniref:Ferrous iron transport protein B n=1 Tax=Persephonella atlantica TaxID=2699429 RepID=A0ABS1GGD8_9AQUI|nr:ferrous iron transport protein B [Persephonella atlantica]MBK3331935.1 ferrous iron transport protein B [Persephonella atlantica]